MVGLLLGYMILSALIGQLRRWRLPQAAAEDSEAQSAARRRFLGWTIVVGAAAAAATSWTATCQRVERREHGTRQAEVADSGKPTPVPPPGADLKIQGLTPYVTANDDFYRIDTALQVP